MNTDPFAIRRSDNPASADALIAKRREPRTDEVLSHLALCNRIDRSLMLKTMLRDMEITVIEHCDAALPQRDPSEQEYDGLLRRLSVGAA